MNQGDPNLNRVDIARKHGRWKDVRIILEKALKADPTNPLLAFRLACVLLATDGAQAALLPARTAQKFSSDNLEINLLLHMIYKELGQDGLAKKTYTHCQLLSHGESEKIGDGKAEIKKWTPFDPTQSLGKSAKKDRLKKESRVPATKKSGGAQGNQQRLGILAFVALLLLAVTFYVNQGPPPPEGMDLTEFRMVMDVKRGYVLAEQQAVILQVSATDWHAYSADEKESAMLELLELAKKEGAVVVQIQDLNTQMLAMAQPDRVSIRSAQ